MTPVEPRAGRSRTTWLAVALLAALAYVPALASSPGKMPADTKLYLYLNPARLISDAPYTFDARQFAGWVPHQVIAYLWPQGPWFWLGDTVRLPDWVVHRLWIGTLMFLAGGGVLWLCRRRFGLGVLASLAAALVYQLSPYLLPYISRTSAMLLPWAGLGWLVGLTMGAALRTRWRDASLAALVVVSIGAVNATAIMMIIPGPLLWLIVAALERQVAWRRAVTAALRIGVLSAAVSLWWIAAVGIQGRLGADVLAYSESLKSVSFTSTSTEVWRGLGYWLTYIRDPYAATTTAGADYMTSTKVILAGFLLLILGVAGLVAVRWRQRRYAVALVVTGVVLGVGVHPIDHPSPLMRLLKGDGESGLALALRSSTRAVPVLALGLGLGIAMVIQVLPAWRRSAASAEHAVGAAGWTSRVPWRALATAGVLVLALVNLPVLTHHALVDPALERDEQPPPAWTDAAAALDAAPAGYRVMELPGAEFGAFRWGYTVDPPLPGLTNRPLVTRDLLPLGSAGAMDLLYALDDRFQAGVGETGAVAPVARLLGADTIWLPGDTAFDRFRTPRPEIIHAQFVAAAADATEGLGLPVPYGPPVPNPPNVPMVDEQSLSDPRVGQPVPPVELVPVQDPEAVVRAKDRSVVIDGSGDGIVDSAAAGLLDGRELIRYATSLSGRDLAAALQDADQVLITDSNRDRAHHWRGSQDVSGFTEPGGPGSGVLDVDEGDQRLPVFANDSARTQTIAVQEGPVVATASSYGEPFAYRPEDRAYMAVDGDPTTAWLVADRAPAEGQRIRFQVSEPIDHVTLHQPQGAGAIRHVGAVTIDVDGRAPEHVTLDDQSLSADGQRVDLDPTTGPSTVTITIDRVVVPDPTLGPASAAVGFSEVDFGLGPTIEVVRPPVVVTGAMASSGTSTPVSYVLTRLRTRPTDRWRSDPEPAMVREVTLPAEQAFTPTVTVRLDQRASDAVLAGLLGISGAQASDRLTGATSAAGWSATDGDPATAWITPFGHAVGSTLDVQPAGPVSELTVTQKPGDFSPVTGLRLTSGATTLDVAVPAPDPNGESHVALPQVLPAGPVHLQITAIDPRTTIDRRYGEPVQLPAAIAELSLGPATGIPAELDTGCRDDLIRIDGQPLPLRVQAAVPALLAGDPVTATRCGTTAVTLGAGTHRITTTPGTGSGLQVDRIVLAGPSPASAAPTAPSTGAPNGPTATVTSSSRLSRKVTVEHCPKGCWLVLGEGFNDSWSASTAAGSLGRPTLVDGGFNGWRIPPSDGKTEVTLHWTSQRPLTVALVLSGLAVLAAIALAVLDRRRAPLPEYALPRPDFPGAPAPRPALIAGAVVWVAAAGLLVGPAWMLAAAVGSAVVLAVLRRPRLAGVVTMGILAFSAVVVVYVVRTDQPFPNAGWPVRFDRLHNLGLFAAVSLLPAVAGWPRRRS
jgi:arabinofuranan 3-O-arabinosyltransferase